VLSIGRFNSRASLSISRSTRARA